MSAARGDPMKAKTLALFSDYATVVGFYSTVKPGLSTLPVSRLWVVDGGVRFCSVLGVRLCGGGGEKTFPSPPLNIVEQLIAGSGECIGVRSTTRWARRVIWCFARPRDGNDYHCGLSVMETIVEPPMADRVSTYS